MYKSKKSGDEFRNHSTSLNMRLSPKSTKSLNQGYRCSDKAIANFKNNQQPQTYYL